MLVGWRQGWRQNRCWNHSLQSRCWKDRLRASDSSLPTPSSGTLVAPLAAPWSVFRPNQKILFPKVISKGCRSSVHNGYKQCCNTIRIILFVRCIDHADRVRSYSIHCIPCPNFWLGGFCLIWCYAVTRVVPQSMLWKVSRGPDKSKCCSSTKCEEENA